jgi:hypothetical protein
VLTGVGPAAAAVAAVLPVGTRVSATLGLPGVTPGTVALGGGPALVVNGRAIHAAGEGFTPDQLNPRSERTAIGQTAGGVDLLVTAEGRSNGSPGITVPQQAELMARLGARNAIAMDSGGSSQMIARGIDVVPWRSPRAISTAMFVRYSGVRFTPLTAPISPNNDGVNDRASLPITVPSPGTLTVAIAGTRGAPVTLLDRAVPAIPIGLAVDPQQLGLADGTYRVTASLTPLLGAVTSDRTSLVIDRTVSDLRIRGFIRRHRPGQQITFRLWRSASVSIRVTTRGGRTLGRVYSRRLSAGAHTFVWNQRIGSRLLVGGADVVVDATARLGRHGLIARVGLRAPQHLHH